MASYEEIWTHDRCFQIFNYVCIHSRLLSFTLSYQTCNTNITVDRNPEAWDDIKFPNEGVKEELTSYIGKRLTPQPTKVRADVEVTCYGYEGIDAVKASLRAAEAKNTVESPVRVKLVSPPLYVLTSQCLAKENGIAVLEEAIIEIQNSITAAGGTCSVKMAPKAVTEADDADLQKLMELRERENAEISGDEDDSQSDEGEVA